MDTVQFSSYCVSIHTPTKGVTYYCTISISVENSFNPHTHEGCDIIFMVGGDTDDVSIHTPTKGVTSVRL